MSMLGRLSRATMLLVVAVASFLVTVPGTGGLFCLGYEYFEAQAALRQANAPGRAGQRDKGEDGRADTEERRRLAREYLPGAVGLIALISVAGGLGISLARAKHQAGKSGPGSSDPRASGRRARAGLLGAILVGMGFGFLAYFGLGYLLVFVLDD